MHRDTIHASLFGAAFGDALAAPVEFVRSAEMIKSKFPPSGPTTLVGEPALVTDDTQMMLAVGQAMVEAGQDQEQFAQALAKRFVEWYHDPRNNRAPGNTCLKACERLDRGEPWQDATVQGSKGCGANMRVQPVGLLPERVRDQDVAGMAQLQAAMTHGHPTALAASDLTAMTARMLGRGIQPKELLAWLMEYAKQQQEVYHEAWLGDFWRKTHEHSAQGFIQRGWRECLGVLERLDLAMQHADREVDPCTLIGEGWIAEEAFGTSLYVFLTFCEEPHQALTRAATTCGDSDSIACLVGSFMGAYKGKGAWQNAWFEQVEYRQELQTLVGQIDALS